MSVLTKTLIKESEEKAVKSGAFSFRELMPTAGTKAFEEIIKRYDVKSKKIAVLCGSGNNGGDGCVIAKKLSEYGTDVTVITPFGIPVTENALYYYNELKSIKKCDTFTDNYDIIIDAIFGIGFSREADDKTKELFCAVNKSKAVKIAIDIPSGVECDKGYVWNEAIKADLTLTFIALKPCFLLPPGSDYCGEVKVIDIGVTPLEKSYGIIKKPIFQKRNHNSHKGTYGTALLICGSYGMAGAAMLSAKSALRSGLGIAKCVVPKSIYDAFTSFLPEAVCVPCDETENGTLDFDKIDFPRLLENCDAVLCGCGLGKGENIKKLVTYLIENCTKPLIIDADGINAIADCIEILRKSKAPIILTPHPGEMARMCKLSVSEIESDRISVAKKFAEDYGCTLVLKGSNTIVADRDGNISFNILGNPGMATGGSGDVLAGITVSLSAQGFPTVTAAKNAVYLHSLAGDKAAEKRSMHALLPSDIIEEL